MVIRLVFTLLTLPKLCKSVLCNSAIGWSFLSRHNLKDLVPSYYTRLTLSVLEEKTPHLVIKEGNNGVSINLIFALLEASYPDIFKSNLLLCLLLFFSSPLTVRQKKEKSNNNNRNWLFHPIFHFQNFMLIYLFLCAN